MRWSLICLALAIACGGGTGTSDPTPIPTVAADGGADGGPRSGDGSMTADLSSSPAHDGGSSSGGRTGLAGFCDHYIECGGSYYPTAQDCIDAGINYWGSCRQTQLDAFGDCMLKLSCEQWGDPNAYNPRATPCATQYQTLVDTSC